MDNQNISDELYKHFNRDVRALNRESRMSFMECIQWSDMVKTKETLPELEIYTRCVIKWRLGYIPPEYVLFSYEYRLREYVKAYLDKRFPLEDFLYDTDNRLRLARNSDIRRHLEREEYDHFIYNMYNQNYLHVASKARERISRFLGYEPDIEASAEAELLLRKKLIDDTVHLPDFLTSHDLQLLTYISYREIYLRDGFQAAEDSPLVTRYFLEKHHPGVTFISDVTDI